MLMPETRAVWDSISTLGDSDEKDALRKQLCGFVLQRLAMGAGVRRRRLSGKPPSLPTPTDVWKKARRGGGIGPRRGRSQLEPGRYLSALGAQWCLASRGATVASVGFRNSCFSRTDRRSVKSKVKKRERETERERESVVSCHVIMSRQVTSRNVTQRNATQRNVYCNVYCKVYCNVYCKVYCDV